MVTPEAVRGPPERRVGIFYSLAPGSWGRGYATEAARAVADHALGPLGRRHACAVTAGGEVSVQATSCGYGT